MSPDVPCRQLNGVRESISRQGIKAMEAPSVVAQGLAADPARCVNQLANGRPAVLPMQGGGQHARVWRRGAQAQSVEANYRHISTPP